MSSKSFGIKYQGFLNRYGISLSLFQVRWFTTYFNRHFVKIGSKRSKFLKVWFNVGIIFSLVLLVMSAFLLVMIIINTFTSHLVQEQVLTPVMPGVNLPMNQIGYYFLTLLICGVLHEVGHALAAVGEEVKVNGFGIFILALYPGAYVDVCTQNIESMSPVRQLRIYCAGVWHNIVIMLVALIFLLGLPTFASFIYKSNHGIIVTHVEMTSPISGVNGVEYGDVIKYVDDCIVNNTDQWAACISNVIQTPTSGYCVDSEILTVSIGINIKNNTKSLEKKFSIEKDQEELKNNEDLNNNNKLNNDLNDNINLQLDNNVNKNFENNINGDDNNDPFDCCIDSHDSHLCFYHLPSANNFHSTHVCLNARKISEGMKCNNDADCSQGNIDVNSLGTNDKMDDKPRICLKPFINNNTWLVKVGYSNNNKLPLLFLGHPLDLYYSLSVSNYEPKWPFLPIHLPYIIETLCKYLVSLSGALAIINIIPCYALDGQWIIQALYNSLLPIFINNIFIRNIIYSFTVMFGTILILSNVLIAFWTLFFR